MFMSKNYKISLLTIIIFSCISFQISAQQIYWSLSNENSVIDKDKAVARQSFPKDFKLVALNSEPLRQDLFSVVNKTSRQSPIITLPNSDGNLEPFEVREA